MRYSRDAAIAWGFALLWMLLIFVLSAQSALGGQPWPPVLQALRKTGHIIEYVVLAVLLGNALVVSWKRQDEGAQAEPTRITLARAWLFGAILATLYAVTDEFHQSFVPQRGAHLEDVIIDALSAIAALGVWYIMISRNTRNA